MWFTITGWWYTTPLKNDGLRQLGWWHFQLIWKVIKVHGSSHHQPVIKDVFLFTISTISPIVAIWIRLSVSSSNQTWWKVHMKTFIYIYIYIFRMIFLSENLHKPSLFRSFSHAFPSLFLWFSLWFFRWIRWGSSRASAEPFGLQHAVLSHRQRLDAIRLHLDGIEKSQAVSGNPWDVSVSHGSLEKAANNQKLRYHGYIIWDICIG